MKRTDGWCAVASVSAVFAIALGCGSKLSVGADQPVAGSGGGPAAGAGGAIGNDGGAPDAPGGATARLVPWQLEAPGAEPLVVGILDTEQLAPCRYVPDEAGTLRCFPSGPVLLRTRRFADATCSEPVYSSNGFRFDGIVSGPVTALDDPRACEQPHRVLRVRAAPSRQYGVDDAGACVSALPGADEEPTVVASEQLPSGGFVAGVEVDGPLLNERIRLRRIQGEDGSQFGSDLGPSNGQVERSS